MSECPNRYYSNSTKDAQCSRPHPVNNVLRASAIIATTVFLILTLLVVLWILHKRGVDLGLRIRPSGLRRPPALYIWSGSTNDSDPGAPQPELPAPATAKSSKGAVAAAAEPVSCVIMAGEERPTHLARPLPMEEFVDVSLDSKLDELERGKRKAPLNSSR